MSILLDALRKSERREHLGEVPTIHQDGDGNGLERSPRARLLVIAALVLAAAVLAVLFWRQYAPEPVGDPEADGAVVAEPLATAPDPVIREPGPGTDAAETTTAGRREARTPMERALAQFAAEEQEPGAASSEPLVEIEPEADDAAEVVTRPPVATVRVPPREVTAPARAAQTGEPAADAAAEQPHQSEPVSYWQLPGDIRSQLPPLKITVLVWAENPQDRFVMLDGRRRVEGDEIAPGLQLVEVRRDGLVMSFRAYRFIVRS